ncbi:LOW QUALITY PROTEIN: uncharacterized protein LOC133836733 [Drosophila sulfurigaster albostrigata]|uniref:LOW QUALITY PROTEIN: uncharacterized protein LOC133836733 n=1 Tax=Drosophila sulfurigaster albostrigata TaxID=89887 RepID=UPI002D21E8A4|nr:LOW QUALITY PROTEIN: uncharacterized protein LOC133836733 [Drosophila sulfurigaster albostrigata]
MNTKQSSTVASASGHDELGNLLWQQEATEFIEQFPCAAAAVHTQHCPVPPIRHCHAHGHGHVRGGGELLSTQQRHQRDMFSGDLGIPEISTHVGSVVHTFETLALQRRLAEAEQERDREQSKYELRTNNQSNSNINSNQSNGNVHTSQSKYSQVKRKSQELRQRVQHMQRQKQKLQAQTLALAKAQHCILTSNNNVAQQQHPAPGKLTNSCSTQSLANQLANLPPMAATTAHSTEHLQPLYGGIAAEDYRKNLFGTLLSQRTRPLTRYLHATTTKRGEEASEEQELATSRTFTNTITNTDDLYDDEHMLVSLSELDDDVFASRAQTASTTPTTAGAGRTPKHSHPALQKYPAPAPPPLQQRSSTLTNLFERLKSSSGGSGKRTNSEQQLQQAAAMAAVATPTPLHKYAAQPQLNEDFNRGSTLSQSFVRQLKRVSHKQKRAPPQPPPKPRSNVAHVTPLRNALIFPKRSRSSNELLLDDLNVQARKYFRRSEHSAAV